MGRWTLDYYDDVLGAKIKGLVDGAIKRAKLEKIEPTITYELFVEELDAGDSFTTSLVDILVKEMAERRTRPTSADRRLIADRSAKSLRSLATPLRVYHDPSSGHGAPARRSVHLTEYLTAPPDEMEMEEDQEEFENALRNAASAAEGARLNSEMYDAFGGFSHRWSSHPGLAMPRRSQADRSSAVTSSGPEDIQVVDNSPASLSYSASPSNRTGPWSFPSNSLSRSTTTRRPVRSRTADFSDFTSRRRSNIRPGSAEEALVSRIDIASEDSQRSLSTWDRPSGQGTPAGSRSPQLARRFFGHARPRRHDTSGRLLFRDVALPNTSSALSEADDLTYWALDSYTSGPLFSPRQPQPYVSRYQAHEAEGGEEIAPEELPRLRRGGIRAPESILTRNASPSLEGVRNHPSVTFSAPSGDEDADGISENLAGST